MSKVKIVAEIGSNWEPGNLASALEMVSIAADCGADAVKFQDFRVDAMDRPDWWRDKCRPWELPGEWLEPLQSEALMLGLEFFCSVWDDRSLRNAIQLRYRAIKIAASEITNRDLLWKINHSPIHIEPPVSAWRPPTVPIYLSVDYRKHRALVAAIAWLAGCNITLLHTVSEYPANKTHRSLFYNLMDFGFDVGWSSHLPAERSKFWGAYFTERGASVVEAHIRSESTPRNSPDWGDWSLYPEEFSALVKAIRKEKNNA